MPHAQLSGARLYHEVHGNSTGSPVVLIVGLAGNHRFWEPLLPAWIGNHRLLIFDWRGMGDSGEGREEVYSTQMLADDVADLMTSVGFATAHILGRSLGGCIAQYLAINHASRVRSLLLASSFARPDAFLRTILESWTRLVDTAGDVILVEQASLWAVPRRMFEPEFAAPFRTFQDVATQGTVLRNNPDEFRKLSRAAQAHNTVPELHRITAPCVVMAGREDLLTPLEFAYQLYDLIPRADLEIFERGGHDFYEQSPQKFSEAARRFWGRVDSTHM